MLDVQLNSGNQKQSNLQNKRVQTQEIPATAYKNHTFGNYESFATTDHIMPSINGV